MTTISNSSSTELIAKVAEWAKMTDDNLHSEVLCDVAFFFELPEYVNAFFPYMTKTSLTMEEYYERYGKSNEMKETIKNAYGENIFNLLSNAF